MFNYSRVNIVFAFTEQMNTCFTRTLIQVYLEDEEAWR